MSGIGRGNGAWTGWTDERVKRLLDLWADGLSAAQIAKKIGGTRNAIIGKAHRLGLTSNTRQPPSTPEAKPRAPRRTKPILKIMGNGAVQEQAPSRPPVVEVKFAEVLGKGLRITDPGFGGCRWPLSGSGADIRFCCAERANERPYCADHAKAAYVPTSSAKELTRALRRQIAA